MKKVNRYKLVFACLVTGSVMMITSCQGNKNGAGQSGMDSTSKTNDSTGTGSVVNTPGADTSAIGATTPYSVSGTVLDITQGKDGYMADLRGEDGKLYSMTVSVLRLQDKYTRFNKGDKVTVSGDTIHLGEKINVLVTAYTKP